MQIYTSPLNDAHAHVKFKYSISGPKIKIFTEDQVWHLLQAK